MPWITVIRDTTPIGVAERSPTPNTSRITATATVIRGVLNLTPDISTLTSDITLLDVSGRKVLDLMPGDNDVSRLAPGIYFVRSTIANRHSPITKVVITR
jgi:hypothetical protein